jgi:hypothetical protein
MLHAKKVRCVEVQPTWVDVYYFTNSLFVLFNEVKDRKTEEFTTRTADDKFI